MVIENLCIFGKYQGISICIARIPLKKWCFACDLPMDCFSRQYFGPPVDQKQRFFFCLIILMLSDADIRPYEEVIVCCVVFLINIHDWDNLISMFNIRNGYIETSRLIALLCKELPNGKNARKAARDLWDACKYKEQDSVGCVLIIGDIFISLCTSQW